MKLLVAVDLLRELPNGGYATATMAAMARTWGREEVDHGGRGKWGWGEHVVGSSSSMK